MNELGERLKVPWRMCRTCHKRGCRFFRNKGSHVEMMSVDKIPCGQCGKKRHLVECHQYDFRAKGKKK